MTHNALDNVKNTGAEIRVVPPFWRLVVKKANPITPLNTQGLAPAFYCVHPIAGDVSSFYALSHHLDEMISFYGVQVPLEKMNAEFGRSVPAMARYYVDKIKLHQPEGPITLGGWSAGAIIALEMAQQLFESGREVPLLVALDGAPCNTDTSINPWNPVFIYKVLCNLPFWVADEWRQSATFLDLVRNVRAKLTFRIRRVMPTIRSEQTLHADAVLSLLASRSWSDSQMDFIKSLYEAMRTYRPKPYKGRVLVFESRTQPLFNLRQVAATWRALNPLAEIVTLKSNHQGIFREPILTSLAQLLGHRLRGS